MTGPSKKPWRKTLIALKASIAICIFFLSYYFSDPDPIHRTKKIYPVISLIALLLSFIVYIKSGRRYLKEIQKGTVTKRESIKTFAALSGITLLMPVAVFLSLSLLNGCLAILGITFLEGNAEQGGWLFIMTTAAQMVLSVMAIFVFSIFTGSISGK